MNKYSTARKGKKKSKGNDATIHWATTLNLTIILKIKQNAFSFLVVSYAVKTS